MMYTTKHVTRLLERHASFLQGLVIQIEDGVDLKLVMDQFIAENTRTQNVIFAFDTQETMAAAPSSLNSFGNKHDGR